ncbi:MAG TPA: metalloregulator ArsR/SmtB family transcription factor [Acidimicrobiia bacterium]|nr:metalloregulator ArsR/SmtB family transcription factor [Acidimicrobiia bacterium]
MAPVLEALADPTRREIVTTLTTGPRRAGELAETAGVTPSAMSRHLSILLKAGLVADERGAEDARVRMFRLRPESTRPLREWLDQLQALVGTNNSVPSRRMWKQEDHVEQRPQDDQRDRGGG